MNLDYKAVLALGAVALVVYFVAKDQIGKGLSAAGTALSPTNHDNIFATGVNSVGSAVSGQKGWTLGGWVYDLTHPTAAP